MARHLNELSPFMQPFKRFVWFFGLQVKFIDKMKLTGTVSPSDLDLCLFTDSVDEAVNHIKENSIKKFNLQPKKPYKPFKWLFEGG